MENYEHIVISAVRYALGRMTYIVNLTVEYVLKDIEEQKLSKKCLWLMQEDIRKSEYLGMECDKKSWQQLLEKIDEVMKCDWEKK